MKTADMKVAIAAKQYRFDRLFQWKAREGRLVPAVRPQSVQLEASQSYLYHDASVLFLSPTPCLDGVFADDFDILCEGDSWSCLSIYPGHVTMVQHLSRMRYAVCNIAKYGRTMQDVQDRKADPTGYLSKLSLHKPRAFIVSAGANDFLGDTILSWLRQRSSGDHDPKNAPKYIDDDQFTLIMNGVAWNYGRLLNDVASRSPETTVMLPSYAHAVGPTTVEGPFLGKYFGAKGFDPIDPKHRPLIQAIVKLLIDRFHRMLTKLKANSKLKIAIVDFRKALNPSDIRDEIHPKPQVAPAMAQKYIAPLKAAGVSPRSPAVAVRRVGGPAAALDGKRPARKVLKSPAAVAKPRRRPRKKAASKVA